MFKRHDARPTFARWLGVLDRGKWRHVIETSFLLHRTTDFETRLFSHPLSLPSSFFFYFVSFFFFDNHRSNSHNTTLPSYLFLFNISYSVFSSPMYDYPNRNVNCVVVFNASLVTHQEKKNTIVEGW
jgi:hypothetical protein